MGLFDKLFGSKKEEQLVITSPLDGKVIKMEDVPDQAFSQKMMAYCLCTPSILPP